MSTDVLPELDETLRGLDQAIGEFRQIKEQLRTGSVQEPAQAQAAVAATALPVESETA